MTMPLTPTATATANTTDTHTEVWLRDFTRSIDVLLAHQTAILQRHQDVRRFIKSDIAPIVEAVAKAVSRYGFKCEPTIATDGVSLYVERDVNHSQRIEEGEFTYNLSFAISVDGVEALWDDQYGRDKPGSRRSESIDFDDLPADIVYKHFDPPLTSLSDLRDRLAEHITQRFLHWFEEVYIDAWLDPRSLAYDRAGALPALRHEAPT